MALNFVPEPYFGHGSFEAYWRNYRLTCLPSILFGENPKHQLRQSQFPRGQERLDNVRLERFTPKADMCALSQKQTYAMQNVISALPPKADMCSGLAYVCFGPYADMADKKRD